MSQQDRDAHGIAMPLNLQTPFISVKETVLDQSTTWPCCGMRQHDRARGGSKAGIEKNLHLAQGGRCPTH